MLKIKQFKYGIDNLAYLVYGNIESAVIDPGCPDKIFDFVKEKNLYLKYIFNTHSHFDHLSGNSRMIELCKKNVQTISENDILFKIDGCDLEIIHTPGHTKDSVCFYYKDNFIITGDTLFIANVGNCSDSLINKFKQSLDKILDLPEHVKIYPGHDYTKRSLKRALTIENDNNLIVEFKNNYDEDTVVSTIRDEKNINPYLRTSQKKIIEHLKTNNKDVSTPFERFKSFIDLY